ncbi:hypothetical protein CsSME_00017552 [Camellia sinensis var. sinensis]
MMIELVMLKETTQHVHQNQAGTIQTLMYNPKAIHTESTLENKTSTEKYQKLPKQSKQSPSKKINNVITLPYPYTPGKNENEINKSNKYNITKIKKINWFNKKYLELNRVTFLRMRFISNFSQNFSRNNFFY